MALMVAAASTPAVLVHGANLNRCYNRFFSFGDTVIDTGNFIYYSIVLGPIVRSPYGETFFHRRTGQWSDDCLIVDFIVERLGFMYYLLYLDEKMKKDFRYGANLAVARGTALNQLLLKKKHLSVDGITPYSLGMQICWFCKVLAMLGCYGLKI